MKKTCVSCNIESLNTKKYFTKGSDRCKKCEEDKSIGDQDQAYDLCQRGLPINEIAAQMSLNEKRVWELINKKANRLAGMKIKNESIIDLEIEEDPQQEVKEETEEEETEEEEVEEVDPEIEMEILQQDRSFNVRNTCCNCGHEWLSANQYEPCPGCGHTTQT